MEDLELMPDKPRFLPANYQLIKNWDFRQARYNTRTSLYKEFYTRYSFSNGTLDYLSGNGETTRARDNHEFDRVDGLKLGVYLKDSLSTGAESTLIRSKYSFTYGYIEAEVQVAKARGVLSALWLIPPVASGSAKPEIDIFEILNGPNDNSSKSYHNLHIASGNLVPPSGLLTLSSSSSVYQNDEDLGNEFHKYGCLWTPTGVTHYLDDKVLAKRQLFWDKPEDSTDQIPAQIIANVWGGGSWVGNAVSGNDYPAYMNIKYIRLYQET